MDRPPPHEGTWREQRAYCNPWSGLGSKPADAFLRPKRPRPSLKLATPAEPRLAQSDADEDAGAEATYRAAEAFIPDVGALAGR